MSNIRKSSQEEHEQLLDEMQEYMEPIKVGIFWYNFIKEELLYPEGKPVTEIGWPKHTTYNKLHQDIWKKLHFKAIATKNINSPAYKERNYTLIPRGRIFIDSLDENKFSVKVGNWINDGIIGPNGEHYNVNPDILRALLICEFNLPDDFEFVIDEHWDIGKGWSERGFK